MKERTALEVLREDFPELAQWIKPLCRFNKDFEDFIEADYKEKKLYLKIYTKEHKYNISARLDVGKLGNGEMLAIDGYLGCIGTVRKPRAGEDWTRGNDLADGSYSKETWDRIVRDILAYELVKVVKPKNRGAYIDEDGGLQPANDSSEEKNSQNK